MNHDEFDVQFLSEARDNTEGMNTVKRVWSTKTPADVLKLCTMAALNDPDPALLAGVVWVSEFIEKEGNITSGSCNALYLSLWCVNGEPRTRCYNISRTTVETFCRRLMSAGCKHNVIKRVRGVNFRNERIRANVDVCWYYR